MLLPYLATQGWTTQTLCKWLCFEYIARQSPLSLRQFQETYGHVHCIIIEKHTKHIFIFESSGETHEITTKTANKIDTSTLVKSQLLCPQTTTKTPTFAFFPAPKKLSQKITFHPPTTHHHPPGIRGQNLFKKNMKVSPTFLPLVWTTITIYLDNYKKKHIFLVTKNPCHTILVGGWTNPFEKYDRQIGSFPQHFGVNINKKNWNHHLTFHLPF